MAAFGYIYLQAFRGQRARQRLARMQEAGLPGLAHECLTAGYTIGGADGAEEGGGGDGRIDRGEFRRWAVAVAGRCADRLQHMPDRAGIVRAAATTGAQFHRLHGR